MLCELKVKKVCFYTVLDRPKSFTLKPDTNSTSLGSILATQQIRANTILTHIATTVYSQVLNYTAESTGTTWRERKFPNFETVARGGFEPGLT